MERDKEAEAKRLAEIEKDDEEEEKIKSERCPHCGMSLASYPYHNIDVLHGWLECCSCGVVFSPKFLRAAKLEAEKNIQGVKGKLLIPGRR